MDYVKRITKLIKKVPTEILDINEPRERTKPPTQAFSEFLTNREQGDWAEKLIFEAINAIDNGIIAVKYGKSDDIIAGEEGFEEFYENYQDELDTIGKRPDLLIFKRADYQKSWNFDISGFETSKLAKIVPKAVAGIEVRSSSFLLKKYENNASQNQKEYTAQAESLKAELLKSYKTELGKILPIIQSLDLDNLADTKFVIPRNLSTKKELVMKEKLQELREIINNSKKREFLSFTPKMEDIKVVYKWIETYQVPHFYFQVFFDSVYGISYEQILTFLTNSTALGKQYFLEKDTKNQMKTTIKIDVKQGTEIAKKVIMPEYIGVMRELDRGRLLFHVTFEGGKATLNLKNFYEILGLTPEL